MAKVEEVEEKLAAQGYELVQKERLPNDMGFQLRFSGGEVVCVFDNGTVTPQGKNQKRTRELLELQIPAKTPRPVFWLLRLKAGVFSSYTVITIRLDSAGSDAETMEL